MILQLEIFECFSTKKVLIGLKYRLINIANYVIVDESNTKKNPERSTVSAMRAKQGRPSVLTESSSAD